jgi:hypothetical protein
MQTHFGAPVCTVAPVCPLLPVSLLASVCSLTPVCSLLPVSSARFCGVARADVVERAGFSPAVFMVEPKFFLGGDRKKIHQWMNG